MYILIGELKTPYIPIQDCLQTLNVFSLYMLLWKWKIWQLWILNDYFAEWPIKLDNVKNDRFFMEFPVIFQNYYNE